MIQVEALTYMTRRYHNIRIAFEAGYDLVDMVGLEIELKR